MLRLPNALITALLIAAGIGGFARAADIHPLGSNIKSPLSRERVKRARRRKSDYTDRFPCSTMRL
jgi:hypothetical protein